MKKCITIIGLMIMTVSAMAASQWLASDKAVLNYLEAMNNVKSIKDVPINMPKALPGDKTYYMTVKKVHHNQFNIYFDSTKKCNGVKTCSVGSILLIKMGNPQIYYNRDNKAITQEVILKNGHKAYFTPAHAMADYWPARMEWRQGPWLLQLNWTAPKNSEKQDLVKLANQL